MSGMSGMNPMMAAMQNGMNPMMAAMPPGMSRMMMAGMNPMMMMVNPAMFGMQGIPEAAQMQPQLNIDSRVRELCRHFDIEEKTTRKLNEALKTREDFDDCIQALWEQMEKAQASNRKASDVLLIKLREIERGTFAGKHLLDPDIKAFSNKYELDDRVLNRLIEVVNGRNQKKKDLDNLDARLDSAKRPAGLLMRLLEGLQERGRLPSPPRNLGLNLPPTGDSPERDRRDHRRRSRSRSQARMRSYRSGDHRR
mmetsp:Transcript_68815/g.149782  ORF Transcript_68815/g.149782 Transcript_68815/m.149782 type:complete len:253 (+) Transcript_68815:3-761(+)